MEEGRWDSEGRDGEGGEIVEERRREGGGKGDGIVEERRRESGRREGRLER